MLFSKGIVFGVKYLLTALKGGVLNPSTRIKARRLIKRCPRRLRVLGGPLLGGFIGLIGGVPGFLIGFLLGYLLRELFSQTILNRKIAAYLENPGARKFYEGEPGLAAWCALGILIAGENDPALSSKEISPRPGERAVKQVLSRAACIFPGLPADPELANRFARLAWSLRDRLNPDLLAESFAARRASAGDAGTLGRALSGLAESEKARRLAREIRLILDPSSAKEGEPENPIPETREKLPGDPWKILGLAPGTEPGEVKAHYRRLAKQFHPDELQVLDEKQREAAASAFVAIKEAYRQISGGH